MAESISSRAESMGGRVRLKTVTEIKRSKQVNMALNVHSNHEAY